MCFETGCGADTRMHKNTIRRLRIEPVSCGRVRQWQMEVGGAGGCLCEKVSESRRLSIFNLAARLISQITQVGHLPTIKSSETCCERNMHAQRRCW